jgi:hypothetical protein
MGDTQIIGFHRDLAPFRADRMNYLNFAELVRRSKIQAPPVFALPAVPDIPELTEPATSEMPEFFDPDGST